MEQTEHNLVKQAAQLNTREEFLRGNNDATISSNRWKNRIVSNVQLSIDIKQSLIARIARLERF